MIRVRSAAEHFWTPPAEGKKAVQRKPLLR